MKQSSVVKALQKDINKALTEYKENPKSNYSDKNAFFIGYFTALFHFYLAKCVGEDESVNNYKVCGDVFGDVRDVLRAEIRKRGGIA